MLNIAIGVVGLLACAAGGSRPTSRAEPPGPPPGATRIAQVDGRFVLLRDGEPYFVRGAAGSRYLDTLVEAGGNAIRTWSAHDAPRILDEAHARGLTVMLGIDLGKERHGFDYGDEASVRAQRERVADTVRRFRDHPALLMWSLGNEVELEGDAEAAFPELDALSRLVHELDPHHPTTTVLAGADPGKVRSFVRLCPDFDVLAINAFGTAPAVPAALDRAGYDGPYVITEYGVRGWWESSVTAWGAPIEPTSAEKVEMYERTYASAVVAERDRCLGSFAFLWGDKQETTATWFGMFLPDGSRTPLVDWATRAWSGRAAADRAPVVFTLDLEPAELPPGAPLEVRATAVEPDGEAMTVRWEVVRESDDRRTGGDAESVPPSVSAAITPHETQTDDAGRTVLSATVRAPDEPGAFRLFVFVRDPAGNAGTANLPFRVVPSAE